MLAEMNDELKGQYVDDAFYAKYRKDIRLKFCNDAETQTVLTDINNFIECDCRNNGLVYVTEYEKGD